MQPNERDSYATYTDFRVSSSSIGALLGAFGSNSRFNTMCKIWDKSTFKDSYREYKKAGYAHWEEDTFHLKLLGILDNWKQLSETAEMASSQSDITFAHEAAYAILFHNQYLLKMKENAIRLLDSPGVVSIIWKVFSGPADHYMAVQELRQKQAELGLDHISPFIKLLGKSARLCYGMMSKSSMAYGTRGESTFIKAHNSAYKVPIERVDHVYSKPVGEFNGVTWGVDGRIDGFKNNTILEIKHRRDEMMEQIPIYEKAQVHSYMFLLDRKEAIWYQCMLNNGLHLSEQRIIQFCPYFWQAITEQVTKSLQFVHHLHLNQIARRAFFLLAPDARDKVMDEFMGSLPL